MRKRERKEGVRREKAMSVLVLVSNMTLKLLQDYVSSSCGDVTRLSLCFYVNMSQIRGKRRNENKDRRREAEGLRKNGGKQRKEREQTGLQQRRVVARRPRAT